MKTKQQKIEEWAKGEGYTTESETVVLIVRYGQGKIASRAWTSVNRLIKDGEEILGLFKPDGTYVPCPVFEDDVEEPKDKFMLDYIARTETDVHYDKGAFARFLKELNSRLKKLEEA